MAAGSGLQVRATMLLGASACVLEYMGARVHGCMWHITNTYVCLLLIVHLVVVVAGVAAACASCKLQAAICSLQVASFKLQSVFEAEAEAEAETNAASLRALYMADDCVRQAWY